MLGGASILLPVRTIISLWDIGAISERAAEQNLARDLLDIEKSSIACSNNTFNRYALNHARIGMYRVEIKSDMVFAFPVLGDNVFGEVIDFAARKLLY